MLWDGFKGNKNSAYGFRKLVVTLSQLGRPEEMRQAANMIAEYKRNLQDPYLQQLLGRVNRSNVPTPGVP